MLQLDASLKFQSHKSWLSIGKSPTKFVKARLQGFMVIGYTAEANCSQRLCHMCRIRSFIDPSRHRFAIKGSLILVLLGHFAKIEGIRFHCKGEAMHLQAAGSRGQSGNSIYALLTTDHFFTGCCGGLQALPLMMVTLNSTLLP